VPSLRLPALSLLQRATDAAGQRLDVAAGQIPGRAAEDFAALVDDDGGAREHAQRPRQAVLEGDRLRPLLFVVWTNYRRPT